MSKTRDLTEAERTLPAHNFKNKLINGGFDVWQRGTSFTATSVYTADRWFLNQGGETSTVAILTVATNGLWEGATLMSFSATASSLANTGRSIQQRIENVNLFKNKDVTLSLTSNASIGQDIYCVVRQVDDVGVTLWVDTVRKIATGDGTIKRDSYTFTLPDITSKYDETNSRFDVIIYPQYTDGSSIVISNIQLEEGSIATPFENRPIGVELALCQRYYEVGQDTRSGVIRNTTGGAESTSFKVNKRITPTMTSVASLTINFTGATTHIPSEVMFQHYPTGGTDNTQGRYTIDWTADAEL